MHFLQFTSEHFVFDQHVSWVDGVRLAAFRHELVLVVAIEDAAVARCLTLTFAVESLNVVKLRLYFVAITDLANLFRLFHVPPSCSRVHFWDSSIIWSLFYL